MKPWSDIPAARYTAIHALQLALLLAFLTQGLMKSAAGSLQLLSSKGAALPASASAGADSVAPWVSPDGRFVAFNSLAGDLAPGDSGHSEMGVFLRDRASNLTTCVSAAFNGSADSVLISASTNGSRVLFQISTGAPDDPKNLFVHDFITGSNELVNVAMDGGPANGPTAEAVMTPDGRYVAFISAATNLVVKDTNNISDVFVRDLAAGTTVLASVGARVSAAAPFIKPEGVLSITPDGRHVAFFSTATNLAAGVPFSQLSYFSHGEVYVRDLVAQTTAWVSSNAVARMYSNAVPSPRNFLSYHPAISDDGRYVVFKTGPATGGKAAAGIFRYDLVERTLTTISTNGISMAEQNDDIHGPAMTPDGRLVVFTERQSNTNFSMVKLWDGQSGDSILVSGNLNQELPANTVSHTPLISADGRRVLFLSNAANLVGDVVSPGFHLYQRDLQASTNRLVDTDIQGGGGGGCDGDLPAMSADGRHVAFSSRNPQLVEADLNESLDVFLRDTANDTTELISKRNTAVVSSTARATSWFTPSPASADGRWVAFASYADDLVTGDTNQTLDVFVHDILTGSNILVSAGIDGGVGRGGYSTGPVISADGRFVAFISQATNLVSGSTNFFSQIYRRDVQGGTTMLVSGDVTGTVPGSNDSSAPAISADGRYVVFVTAAGNLGAGPGVYRRDMESGTNQFMSNSTSNLAPGLSLDGRFVAFSIAGSQVRVFDTVSGTNVFTSSGAAVTSMALSPGGRRLLCKQGSVVAIDFDDESKTVSFVSAVEIQNQNQWSTNGRFFAFVTASNAVVSGFPADSNAVDDVYLYDFEADLLTLVSVDSSLGESGSGPSDAPVVSGDGRFVAFRSLGTNLVTGSTTGPNIFVFDRLAGSNLLLTLPQSDFRRGTWVSRPAVSTSGGRTIFRSSNPEFVPNDLNVAHDLFVAVVTAAADTDHDGLPDEWMVQHFGHPIGAADDLSRAEDDADEDGLSNRQEFTAGTDPKDSASVFGLQIAPVVATNGVVLNWPAAPGRTYRIQYKDDLSDPVWSAAPGSLTVTGAVGSYTGPAVSPRRYYLISTVE